ncbi:MAG TPA: PilZ domain-containing protein [Bryobacteraceae bacterium]|nr:PilZ domain-containing protein [Bryobacteraceae bacterium]
MAESRGDLRRHARVTMDSPVQVLWRDPSGTEMSVNGRTVDISEAGLCIKVPVPIEKGVYVGFNASKVPLRGTASVRSCRRQGVAYLVGLEFSGNLRWKPKPGGAEENK